MDARGGWAGTESNLALGQGHQGGCNKRQDRAKGPRDIVVAEAERDRSKSVGQSWKPATRVK